MKNLCEYHNICVNFTNGGCSHCSLSVHPRSNAHDMFVSNKCGVFALFCIHSCDISYCSECDPFDPPCCLFKGKEDS